MNKFQVGDKVRCIKKEGKNNGANCGWGWKKGHEFVIQKVTSANPCVYWGGIGHNGVYEPYLELVESKGKFKIGDKVKFKDYLRHDDWRRHEGEIATIIAGWGDPYNIQVKWSDKETSTTNDSNLILVEQKITTEEETKMNPIIAKMYPDNTANANLVEKFFGKVLVESNLFTQLIFPKYSKDILTEAVRLQKEEDDKKDE